MRSAATVFVLALLVAPALDVADASAEATLEIAREGPGWVALRVTLAPGTLATFASEEIDVGLRFHMGMAVLEEEGSLHMAYGETVNRTSTNGSGVTRVYWTFDHARTTLRPCPQWIVPELPRAGCYIVSGGEVRANHTWGMWSWDLWNDAPVPRTFILVAWTAGDVGSHAVRFWGDGATVHAHTQGDRTFLLMGADIERAFTPLPLGSWEEAGATLTSHESLLSTFTAYSYETRACVGTFNANPYCASHPGKNEHTFTHMTQTSPDGARIEPVRSLGHWTTNGAPGEHDFAFHRWRYTCNGIPCGGIVPPAEEEIVLAGADVRLPLAS